MRFFFVLSTTILLSIYLPNSLSAQLSYKSGYVITNSQDTIKGKIGTSRIIKEMKYCYFKPNGSNHIVRYSPNDVYAFGLGNESYFLSTSQLLIEQKSQYFAQVLVRGKISLLKLDNQYILVLDDKIIPLEKDFNLVLGDLLKDCKDLKYDILLAKRDDKHLADIVYKYNDFVKSKYTVYKYLPPKIIIATSIGVGTSSSQLNSTIDNNEEVSKKKTGWTTQIQGGINFDIMFPRFSKKASLNLGSYYTNATHFLDISQAIKSPYTESATTFYDETELSFSEVQIPLLFKYNLSSLMWNFHVGAGLANHFIFNAKSTNLIESETDHVVVTDPFANDQKINSTQQGLLLVCGTEHVLMHRFDLGIELRVEVGSTIYQSENKSYSIKSNTRNVSATVFYKF